ncbi:3-deoxy-7-phosphoheptulonate synthase [Ceraceosorus guamensis]|uniref:Phospho-2-dehydro-3-deoxyheptonate aldolase n=1 Tax=Ceraceosorus guamensis TaxID=1522189 RepID=A0A316VQE7_9BASI|nr:3-deoxy-7-phosphoheptulonate synthase [Ceraceosorus guamensis]PWN39816.1 3-deoxy-7-phosphoheptulonate synthase [Ceraceosorus guamensis]
MPAIHNAPPKLDLGHMAFELSTKKALLGQQQSLKTQATAPTETDWHPTSWRSKPVTQDIVYPDQGALFKALSKISHLPSLVSAGEIERAREDYARGARGEAFFLHGGDCAEAFNECTEDHISAQLRILLQMSFIIFMGAKTPVVRVGRIAGQYAKPRSKLAEVVDGKEYPSFRGDSVNGMDLTDRQPDPDRLVSAYFHSSTTINYLRSLSTEQQLLDAAIKELNFDADSIDSEILRVKAHQVHSRIEDALLLYASSARNGDKASSRTLDHLSRAMGSEMLWTSHEALNLSLEEASVRSVLDPVTGATHHYDSSAHMIWTGERTRQLEGGHIEFMRGLRNPIGCKIGPTMQPDELVALLNKLDPDYQDGRVTLITRLGVDKVDRFLPPLIDAVQASGHRPLWLCDPCHGNGKTTPTGIKTRDFADIFGEIEKSISVHNAMHNPLGGLHLELTGDNVTECTGGCIPLGEDQLGSAYKTLCDPRLSAEQSLHLALLVSRRLEGDNLHAHLSSAPVSAASSAPGSPGK